MSDRIEGAAETLVDKFRTDLRSQEDGLVNSARWIIEKMERLIAAVQAGEHVNSLGELQGAASDLDRACALREASTEALVATEHAFERMGVAVPPSRYRQRQQAKAGA